MPNQDGKGPKRGKGRGQGSCPPPKKVKEILVAKEQYTEAAVRCKLDKQGCKISGSAIHVPRGRIGIKGLGMVDFLVKQCKMVAKYE